MKASPLLRAWLGRLAAGGVRFRLRHSFAGFDQDGQAQFDTAQGRVAVKHDATVLALGGASWPRLGSDGAWTAMLPGIEVTSLQPANCGFVVAWTDIFRARAESLPLKRIALSFGGHSVRGECIITHDGLEGGAVYALSAPLRDAIVAKGDAVLRVDLLADVALEALVQKLSQPRGKQSLATFLRKQARLSPVAVALLHESAISTATPPGAMTPSALAALIKAVPVRLTGVAPMARAISTAGGIAFGELDDDFMLRKMPGVFAAGEMLDWEAPTGGYLLQACLSTGRAAGAGVVKWLTAK